jgi:hypothetical protein
MILLTSYFDSQNDARNAELDECYLRNSECKAFSEIHVMLEGPAVKGRDDYPAFRRPNQWLVPVTERMTYQNYFQYANNTFPVGTAVCVSNADIWFNETLLNITDKQLDANTFFACSKWGFMAHPNGQWYWDEGFDLNAPISQDAWMFRTPIPCGEKFNFRMGHMRCDNVLAARMQEAGYRVLNPTAPGPRSLVLRHVHKSQLHRYGADVQGPSIYVHPVQLG